MAPPIPQRRPAGGEAPSSPWLRIAGWLEAALVQTLLNLALWPLKLIYRRPQETWPAWFANQKLCAVDRRFC